MTARNLLRRVSARIGLERDLWNWTRMLEPLRAAVRPEYERAVLFCDLMAMPATAKVESLIAGLLRLKRYRVIVLLEKSDVAIEQIFRAAVPDTEFVYLNDAIGDEQKAQARRDAEQIMAGTPDLQDLVKLEIDGFRIGRNVQSRVLREFRVGRLNKSDPAHQEATRRTLAQSLAVKSCVERILTGQRPDLAVFIERGYTPAGEVFDGCLLHGVDTVQWCGAPQSDCLIYRRYAIHTRGEHPLALSDAMWDRLQSIPWSKEDDEAVAVRIAANYRSGAWYNRQQLQEGKIVVPVSEVHRKLALDPSKKTAVIFSHVLYDATFFYGDSLFDDYEQWLVETVRAAVANSNLNWIVKIHPVNVWRSRMDGAPLVQLEERILTREFNTLPSHVALMTADTDINTFSLFEVANYGLTVRGTIGMELPCFGIPVITAGTGRYAGRGFTIDPASRNEYIGLLGALHKIDALDRAVVRRARLHYYGALNLRPVPMSSFVLDYSAGSSKNAVNQYDVRLNQRPDESLLETKDLGRLVSWLTQSQAPELLSRDI